MEEYNSISITKAEKKRENFRKELVTLKRKHPEYTIRELSKLTKTSYSKIYPILKAYGLSSRSNMITLQAKDEIVKQYKAQPHLSLVKLSKLVGVSPNSISIILDELGLRKRETAPINGEPKPAHLLMVSLKHENPLRTLQSIAEEVGCTRERVRQILQRYGLDKIYPADSSRQLRNKTYRNCTQCNAYLPSGTGGRKDGVCSECKELKRVAKKYSNFSCPQCGSTFVLREREYYWRQFRKQEYIDRTGNGKTVTPVTCSYECSATLRKFGEVDGWGSARHKKRVALRMTQKSIGG